MRILHIANVRWFNATAWYAMELARLQLAAGHEVHTLVLPGTRAEAAAQERGLPCLALDHNPRTPWGTARLMAQVGRLRARLRPQVVHCHRGEHFWLWAVLRRLHRDFALVRTRGDQRPPRPDPLNRWLHRQADALVSTNSITTARFRAMGLPEARIHQILGGVDTARFAPDPAARLRLRASLGYGPEHVVLGLLGRLDAIKGQREAIAALRQLHDAGHTHLRLLLIGFSSALPRSTVETWVREAGLAHAVAITGQVAPVADYLNAADLALVPSLGSEAIARAALEWMACDVPVLASRVGVLPDLLAAEALVPPGDVPALAARIAAALEPDFRQRLLEQQRRQLPGLTSQAFLQATMAVYAQALERAGVQA